MIRTFLNWTLVMATIGMAVLRCGAPSGRVEDADAVVPHRASRPAKLDADRRLAPEELQRIAVLGDILLALDTKEETRYQAAKTMGTQLTPIAIASQLCLL